MKRLLLAAFLGLLGVAQAQAANISNCTQQRHAANDYSCNAVATPQVPDHYLVQLVNASGTNPVVAWQPTSSIATTTATASANSNVLTVASGSGIALGQTAAAVGVPVGATVIAISGTTITLSDTTSASLSTTAITFFNAQGWNGTKIMALACESNDPTTRNVTVQVVRGGTTFILEKVPVIALAGDLTQASPIGAIDMFNPPGFPNHMRLPHDDQGNLYLTLMPNDVLQLVAAVAVTTADAISCDMVASDY